MTTITTPFLIFWFNFTTSLSVQIFVAAATVLFAGLLLLSWINAHYLAFLNPVPISVIEQRHPHLPSFQAIVIIFLCCITLLIVALQTMSGRPPFDGPFEWLYLAAFFVLSGATGILAELHWRGARNIAFAVIAGTVFAFLLIVFFLTLALHQPSETLLQSALLLMTIIFAWRNLCRTWTRQTLTITGSVLLFWLAIYLFH